MMKKIYLTLLVALGAFVLSWFLPWLYSIVFPVKADDPFLAYSPVCDSFIVSENLGDGKTDIYSVDKEGRRVATFSKEERDSLLPQIYFNQLAGREALPDSIGGVELSLPALKHGQWVFSSLPRDINKVKPEVFLIMESMPERFDLEDPDAVFTLDGCVEFRRIADGKIDASRSRRFDEVFRRCGFEYPARSLSANITTRKPYDEGYLIADASGKVFHMKMQAGRPYMSEVSLPDSVEAADVFIMENPDSRQLGLVSAVDGSLYAIEREAYRAVKLPVGEVFPRSEKISIVKNLFNWVLKISGEEGTRWYALDSYDYRLLGSYSIRRDLTVGQRAASFIFPFQLTFTSISDCFARPRIISVSPDALYLNVALAFIMVLVMRRRRVSRTVVVVSALATGIFGIFIFVPLLLIKD